MLSSFGISHRNFSLYITKSLFDRLQKFVLFLAISLTIKKKEGGGSAYYHNQFANSFVSFKYTCNFLSINVYHM